MQGRSPRQYSIGYLWEPPSPLAHVDRRPRSCVLREWVQQGRWCRWTGISRLADNEAILPGSRAGLPRIGTKPVRLAGARVKAAVRNWLLSGSWRMGIRWRLELVRVVAHQRRVAHRNAFQFDRAFGMGFWPRSDQFHERRTRGLRRWRWSRGHAPLQMIPFHAQLRRGATDAFPPGYFNGCRP
jgi:hypothetical protein